MYKHWGERLGSRLRARGRSGTSWRFPWRPCAPGSELLRCWQQSRIWSDSLIMASKKKPWSFVKPAIFSSSGCFALHVFIYSLISCISFYCIVFLFQFFCKIMWNVSFRIQEANIRKVMNYSLENWGSIYYHLFILNKHYVVLPLFLLFVWFTYDWLNLYAYIIRFSLDTVGLSLFSDRESMLKRMYAHDWKTMRGTRYLIGSSCCTWNRYRSKGRR